MDMNSASDNDDRSDCRSNSAISANLRKSFGFASLEVDAGGVYSDGEPGTPKLASPYRFSGSPSDSPSSADYNQGMH